MKTIVFSDIHGNIQALEAMLKQADACGVKRFIFCGDIMGYFLHQEEVIKHFRQLPELYAVAGNHDFYYLHTTSGSRERIILTEKYGRSYEKQLCAADLEYLRHLPQSVEIELDGMKVLVIHGSMECYREGRIYPDTAVDPILYGSYDLVISGHTHYRMCRMAGNTILLNPGSLGQPRDGRGFGYCLIDVENEMLSFQNVRIEQDRLLYELDLCGENKRLIRYLRSKMEEDI